EAVETCRVGYDAITYQTHIQVDNLKFVQYFLRDMITKPYSQTILECIVAMAHKQGLKVISEGIETPAQRDMLRSIGCDYGQGFLFSKPVPATGFQHLLLHWHQ